MNEITQDHQCGFHHNSSTMDKTFHIQQIKKKQIYNGSGKRYIYIYICVHACARTHTHTHTHPTFIYTLINSASMIQSGEKYCIRYSLD
jgi:hypothetical protein